MRRAFAALRKVWRRDLRLRESWTGSDSHFLATLALVVPFGWAVLLFRLEPLRARDRASRDW